MKGIFTTKRLCRAGIIAALYAVLTYALAPFAFGPLQLRLAEALCILPLFFPEAVLALYAGCMLSNLASPFFIYDVFIGSLATLLAAFGTYLVGRCFEKDWVRIFLGGLFPVVFNAVIIPAIIVFLCGGAEGYANAMTAYFAYMGSIALTESVCIFALGTPLYFAIKRITQKRTF
jgi:uncharacterized membrane protein